MVWISIRKEIWDLYMDAMNLVEERTRDDEERIIEMELYDRARLRYEDAVKGKLAMEPLTYRQIREVNKRLARGHKLVYGKNNKFAPRVPILNP